MTDDERTATLGRDVRVTTRAALLADGVSRGTVRRHLRAGRWRAVGPRAVVMHNGPLGRDDRLHVAVLTTCSTAALAGLTAAAAGGLRGFSDPTVHVCVPKGAHVVHMPGVVVHVLRRRRPEDVLPGSCPPRVRMPLALVDAALWARTPRGGMTLLAAGVQQRLATVEQLREALDRVRRHPHRRQLLLTLADVEMGAEALSEIDFARLCRRAGLPEPDRQVVRRDPHGRRRYLDAHWDAYGLTAEIDGAHHAEVVQWSEDLERQNDEVIVGGRVLRFSAISLRAQPERVLAQLARALARRAG